MEERNANSVSLTFPRACWMKTKKGIFDFAFNLQEIMTQNHIILSGFLLAQSNDQKLSNSYFLILMKPLNFELKCKRNLEKEETIKE